MTPIDPGQPMRLAVEVQLGICDQICLPASLSLDGLQLRRALEPGTVLTAAHVQPRPSVSRDDRVTVRVVQGTVTIETTGRALSDARIGELIKVSSTTSIEPYTARVVADGVVLVGTR